MSTLVREAAKSAFSKRALIFFGTLVSISRPADLCLRCNKAVKIETATVQRRSSTQNGSVTCYLVFPPCKYLWFSRVKDALRSTSRDHKEGIFLQDTDKRTESLWSPQKCNAIVWTLFCIQGNHLQLEFLISTSYNSSGPRPWPIIDKCEQQLKTIALHSFQPSLWRICNMNRAYTVINLTKSIQ